MVQGVGGGFSVWGFGGCFSGLGKSGVGMFTVSGLGVFRLQGFGCSLAVRIMRPVPRP